MSQRPLSSRERALISALRRYLTIPAAAAGHEHDELAFYRETASAACNALGATLDHGDVDALVQAIHAGAGRPLPYPISPELPAQRGLEELRKALEQVQGDLLTHRITRAEAVALCNDAGIPRLSAQELVATWLARAPLDNRL